MIASLALAAVTTVRYYAHGPQADLDLGIGPSICSFRSRLAPVDAESLFFCTRVSLALLMGSPIQVSALSLRF